MFEIRSVTHTNCHRHGGYHDRATSECGDSCRPQLQARGDSTARRDRPFQSSSDIKLSALRKEQTASMSCSTSDVRMRRGAGLSLPHTTGETSASRERD